MMRNETVLYGQMCPDCGAQLYYAPGDWGDFESPPEPDSVYCRECGFDRDPTAADYEILEVEDGEI